MFTFYDSENKPYVLTEQLGRGGEGTVFECGNDLELVAKIYHEAVTDEKVEKLRWMAENKNEHLLKVAAWVVDVLKDAPDGKVVGFLMPNVRAKEIHELYSLKSRRVHFPEATWHFLVHASANLARAFYSLHRDDHVMGDINHGNCVVLADGTVKLIDCDSYSISRGDFRYSCEVGVATHLAPELQGVDLGETEREAKHDNFGLAVIIFQLLFLGRHPFSGNYLGAEDKSLEDCIREKRFAYGDNIDITKVKQPPGTLSLSEVSPRLAAMFERAFLLEDRPEPREWVEALEDMSRSLEQCALHPGHHYYEKLAACPWCRIEGQTGLMLFPFTSLTNDPNADKPFNIFTIENLIANLGINQNLPAKPQLAEVLPPPSVELISTRKNNRSYQIAIVAAQFFLICIFMLVAGIGVGVFLGIILMIFFIVTLNSFDKNLRGELNERLFEMREKWNEIENNWSKAVVPQNVNNDLTHIRKKIDSYQKLQQLSANKLKLLREDTLQTQFSEYLRSFKVADCKILGVSEEDHKTLLRKRVKTAAEIEEKRLLNFYHINPQLTEKLIDWRKEVERKFEFDDNFEIPEDEQQKITLEVAGKRRAIEREIEQIFASLRSASVNLRHQQKQLLEKSESIGKEILQTESDLFALGNSSAAIVVLILVTFMTPFWGGVIGGFSSNDSKTESLSGYPPPPRPASGRVTTRTEPDRLEINSARVSEYNVPNENISDEEINEISTSDQSVYVNALIKESEQAIQQKDFQAAERKLRFASRFSQNKIQVLNKLGYALYLQDKYQESLTVLEKSLKIDKKNQEAKNFIGINYLKMKQYDDARRVFTELTAGDYKSLEGFFNLGLAHEGLKDYKSAIKAFRRAIKIDNNDADSHYELGYCLYKTGDKSGAYAEFENLNEMNSFLAQKLYDTAELGKYDYKILPRTQGIGSGSGSGSGDGYGSGSGNASSAN